MATAQTPQDMDADDLTRTDRAILDVLKEGCGGDEPWGIATKGRLVDETDFSRNSVYNRLEVLEAAGFVELTHEPTREFKFVKDPREDGDPDE
ncbi:helix-turn-helix transcriptional regulator [Natrinema ejinorense]|nr:ArsR family transcriptional regulator [Natrinema ejinorense]